jgi:hypothetical protein
MRTPADPDKTTCGRRFSLWPPRANHPQHLLAATIVINPERICAALGLIILRRWGCILEQAP